MVPDGISQTANLLGLIGSGTTISRVSRYLDAWAKIWREYNMQAPYLSFLAEQWTAYQNKLFWPVDVAYSISSLMESADDDVLQ